jgi:hypothetical protein
MAVILHTGACEEQWADGFGLLPWRFELAAAVHDLAYHAGVSLAREEGINTTGEADTEGKEETSTLE